MIEEPTPSPEHPSQAPPQILVVDDNPTNQRMLQMRLVDAGYRVRLASDGAAALEALAAVEIDLVLLDQMMPGLSGSDVLERVRRTRSPIELPVIMVTAVDRRESIVSALEAGANDYVTKPIDAVVLLARVRTQLRAKQLNDLRELFLRIASHDLRSPLTTVIGSARLLARLAPPGTPLSAEQHAMLAGIERAGDAMLRIITDFLDQQTLADARIALAPEAYALNAVVAEAAADHGIAAQDKQIQIVTELEPTLPEAWIDPSRVRQVVDNLLGNAIKFAPHGTTVRLITSAGPGAVELRVIDEGPGFTPADRERLFQPYARLSARPTAGEPSTGLGLSICRQLVEAHGGTIEVEERSRDAGATLCVRLPRAGDRGAGAPRRPG